MAHKVKTPRQIAEGLFARWGLTGFSDRATARALAELVGLLEAGAAEPPLACECSEAVDGDPPCPVHRRPAAAEDDRALLRRAMGVVSDVARLRSEIDAVLDGYAGLRSGSPVDGRFTTGSHRCSKCGAVTPASIENMPNGERRMIFGVCQCGAPT